MLATAVIMLVFPWLAVTFIKGDGGMATCFILFFAVNPIYVICSGAYAGKNIAKASTRYFNRDNLVASDVNEIGSLNKKLLSFI